jgi:hypothetical protein
MRLWDQENNTIVRPVGGIGGIVLLPLGRTKGTVFNLARLNSHLLTYANCYVAQGLERRNHLAYG